MKNYLKKLWIKFLNKIDTRKTDTELFQDRFGEVLAKHGVTEQYRWVRIERKHTRGGGACTWDFSVYYHSGNLFSDDTMSGVLDKLDKYLQQRNGKIDSNSFNYGEF